MDGHEFAYPSCGGGTGISRGLDSTDVTSHQDGDVAGADIFLAHEHDIRAFNHRVRRFDGANETLGLHHAERICCHFFWDEPRDSLPEL